MTPREHAEAWWYEGSGLSPGQMVLNTKEQREIDRVAKIIEKAVEEEREACAKSCDQMARISLAVGNDVGSHAATACAELIRVRGIE